MKATKKQTAVEWLIQELRGVDEDGDFIFQGVITLELINQAKEMEKEQIIDAVNDQVNRYNGMATFRKDGKQYYTETYETN